jgi:hypothetical protein
MPSAHAHATRPPRPTHAQSSPKHAHARHNTLNPKLFPTPHKAIRRHTHHLIDHLAQIEALLDGRPSRADEWRGSFVTLASDWAPFTEADLNEARPCLRRLADLYVQRLSAAGIDEWDKPRDPHWTVRRITEHVGKSWHAQQ